MEVIQGCGLLFAVFYLKEIKGVLFLKNATSVFFQIMLMSATFPSPKTLFFLLIMTTLKSIFYPKSSIKSFFR